MKFPIRITKHQQVGLLFSMVCLAANGASIVDEDSNLLEEYQGVAAISQLRVKKLLSTLNENNKQHKSSGIKLEEQENTIFNLSRKLDQLREDGFFPDSIAIEISDGMEQFNAIQNALYFYNTKISTSKINQYELIENSQQLKMLANELFDQETYEGILNARHEMELLFNQADAWIKDIIFDDSIWRLEDTIYGSAAIMFINDSALLSPTRKLAGNPDYVSQNKEFFEPQNDIYQDAELVLDSEQEDGMVVIFEFLKRNAIKLIFLFVSMVIFREMMTILFKGKPEKAQKSKERLNRSSNPVREKKNASSLLLSSQGRVIDHKSQVDKGEKEKRSSRHHHSRRQYKR